MILIALLALLTPANVAATEGFHPIDKIPAPLLAEHGVEDCVVAQSALHAGVLLFTRRTELTPDKAAKMRQWFCGPEARAIEGPFCAALDKLVCRKECAVEVRRAKCTGVRVGRHFAVSRHCLPDRKAPKDPQAMFWDQDGKASIVNLKPTPATEGAHPYDLAVFAIDGEAGSSLTIAAPKAGEPVFAVGVPFVGMRKDLGAKPYSTTFGMRVTFGRVRDANPSGKSFCQYTNEDVADIEGWKLEAQCDAPKPGRQLERDPVLTDTDMTYGMSGAPLFNARGELVGIGSGVLSRTPAEYSPGKLAVHDKATRLKVLLEQQP